jgi:hypothetical protein
MRADAAAALDPENLFRWSLRWMAAEQELSATKGDRIATADAHPERMKKRETVFEHHLEGKRITPAELAAAAFYRLEAGRNLAQLKST